MFNYSDLIIIIFNLNMEIAINFIYFIFSNFDYRINKVLIFYSNQFFYFWNFII